MNTPGRVLPNNLTDEYISLKTNDLDKFLKFANHVTSELSQDPNHTNFFRWEKYVESILNFIRESWTITIVEADAIKSQEIECSILSLLEVLIKNTYFHDNGDAVELEFATNIYIRLSHLLWRNSQAVKAYCNKQVHEILVIPEIENEEGVAVISNKHTENILYEARNLHYEFRTDLDENILPWIQHLIDIVEKPHDDINTSDRNIINGVLHILEEEWLSFNKQKIVQATLKQNGIAYVLNFILDTFFYTFRDWENELRMMMEVRIRWELWRFYNEKNQAEVDDSIDHAVQEKLWEYSVNAMLLMCWSERGANKFDYILWEAECIYQKLRFAQSRWEAIVLLNKETDTTNIIEICRRLDNLLPESEEEVRKFLWMAQLSASRNSSYFFFLQAFLYAWYFNDSPEIYNRVIDYCGLFYSQQSNRNSRSMEKILRKNRIDYNMDLLKSEQAWVQKWASQTDIHGMMEYIETLSWIEEIMTIMTSRSIAVEQDYINLFHNHLRDKHLISQENFDDILSHDNVEYQLCMLIKYILITWLLNFDSEYEYAIYNDLIYHLEAFGTEDDITELENFFNYDEYE